MDRPLCTFCHQVIGVYEPIRLVFSDGANRHGSVLTFGEQLDAPGSIVLHERCYKLSEHGRGEAGADAGPSFSATR